MRIRIYVYTCIHTIVCIHTMYYIVMYECVYVYYVR